MNPPLRIGVIGDFDPNRRSHTATNEALSHAARALSVTVNGSWLPTPALDDPWAEAGLRRFDALWYASGSPCQSMNGALRAIRFAREMGWPFLGT
jgi:CTP synthase (UTP-ammonia lyase)